MKYRIDQLQVSGTHGCVCATVLSSNTIGRDGILSLTIREAVTILSADQAAELARFLLAFESNVCAEGNAPSKRDLDDWQADGERRAGTA